VENIKEVDKESKLNIVEKEWEIDTERSPCKRKRNRVMPCTGEGGSLLSTKLNMAPLSRRP
jgi:hypothetical protein